MKHQYESEILFNLMERDGFNIPSSVPPYESEIKAYLINQVKLAYPKLTDYEAEWLLYNYTKHLPADFPISSATNVTKATFENVVPFAYQSAILKGQTLVNVLDYTKVGGNVPLVKNNDVIVIESPTENTWRNVDINFTYLKPNTKYIVTWDSIAFSNTNFTPSSSLISMRLKSGNTQIAGWNSSQNYIIATTPSDASDVILRVHATQGTAMINKTTIKGLKVLEYVGGMENMDIPYFEGMQSVKRSTSNPVGKNLFNINRKFIETKATHSINGSSLIVTGDWYVRQDIVLMPYTAYTLSYEKAESVNGYTKISVYANNLSISLGTSNTNELTFTTPASFNNISIVFYAEEGRSTNTVTYTNIQLEEGSVATSYEPYKAAVLTITGKNLFDGELEMGGLSNVNGLPVDNQPDRCRSKNYIKVNSSTDYVISHKHSGIVGIREFDEDYKLVSWASLSKGNTFATSNKTMYLKFIIINTIVDNLVQLEEGTTATPYEPYKANILTVNEEVELRGFGEVQDTLDCLTGEVVERVGEIVLDGSQPIFKLAYEKDDTAKCCVVRIKLDGAAVGDEKGVYTNIWCDKYKIVDTVEGEQNSEGIKLFNQLDYIEIRISILKTKLSSCNITGINAYLSSNPVTVQYELETASIKTVDLETVNESGESVHFMPLEGTMHVQSSGEPIQPTFDMSVPVEATTQNLASFINLEMEE